MYLWYLIELLWNTEVWSLFLICTNAVSNTDPAGWPRMTGGIIHYAGFSLDCTGFLCSGQYGTTFWICAGNSVNNTGMFLLQLSRACKESRPSVPLTPPQQWQGWGAQGAGRGHRQDSWPPTDQRDVPAHMVSCSASKPGVRGKKGEHSELRCLSFFSK